MRTIIAAALTALALAALPATAAARAPTHRQLVHAMKTHHLKTIEQHTGPHTNMLPSEGGLTPSTPCVADSEGELIVFAGDLWECYCSHDAFRVPEAECEWVDLGPLGPFPDYTEVRLGWAGYCGP